VLLLFARFLYLAAGTTDAAGIGNEVAAKEERKDDRPNLP
jgi:hypothetical protein